MSSVLNPWLPIYPCVHAIRCPFLYMFHSEKNLNLFATNRCNKMYVCVRLLEWLHWWHICLCNLLEKRYLSSPGIAVRRQFFADTLRYHSWPTLSRSWHLAASGMGLGVMSHQAGLLTTLHHIHVCFPEQGGNMVTTMGWGSNILGTYSVLPYWWIKLACITTIYHWCIYSIVLQMNAGFPFPLSVHLYGPAKYPEMHWYINTS